MRDFRSSEWWRRRKSSLRGRRAVSLERREVLWEDMRREREGRREDYLLSSDLKQHVSCSLYAEKLASDP